MLIHVLKTHKLETKGITREFYLSRIFPLGFLMVRARSGMPPSRRHSSLPMPHRVISPAAQPVCSSAEALA